MTSQIKKWLKEPKFSLSLLPSEVTIGLCFFNFNSVGLDAFPWAKFCFICLLILSLAIVVIKNAGKVVNTFRLDNIIIKTKNLEYLEKEKKVFAKIPRPAPIPKGKKERSRKAHSSRDAP